MADQFPAATKMVTLSDRIARALCVAMWPDRNGDGPRPCSTPCPTCRDGAAAAAHEIADWLRERHGGASTTADLLDGVGCHQPDAEQSIRDGWKALERKQDPRVWQPIDPEKVAMALAIARELRGADA